MEIIDRSIKYDLLRGKNIVFPEEMFDSVFHYTSASGLNGIISNKTLYFSDMLYLNDKDEIYAGMSSFCKAIGVSPDRLPEIQDERYFVCCFSIDEDSLPMWNYYTKDPTNNGYNIGFDLKQLIYSIIYQNEFLNGCSLSFGGVDYSVNDSSVYANTLNDSIKRLIEKIGKKLLQGDDDIDISEETINKIPFVYTFNGLDCDFIQSSSELLCYIKRNYFSYEKEVRIVISMSSDKLSDLNEKGYIKTKVSKGIIVPYIEVKYNPAAIKSIMISPTLTIDIADLSVKDLLARNSYEKQIDINHSIIPVRY